MTDNAIDIIPAANPFQTDTPSSKRLLAEVLDAVGKEDLTAYAFGDKRIPKRRYLAMMLWQLVTEGEVYFADGRVMKIDAFKDWLDAVKFLHNHLDGPVTVNANLNTQVNIFKVYAGFDPDKV